MPDLMRQVLTLALESFEANRKSYHLSCDPTRIPTDPTDDEVARLMDVIDSRQVLHVGYGAILDEFGSRMYQVWNDNEEELYGIISDHFVKHLAPFAPTPSSDLVRPASVFARTVLNRRLPRQI